MRILTAVAAVGLGSAGLTGCAWGLRGSVDAQMLSSNRAVVLGTTTAVVGFATTHGLRWRSRSSGLLATASLATGADTSGDPVVAGFGGLEWFGVPEHENARWGYHFGVEYGLRGGGYALRELDFIVQTRGGPMFRLRDREAPEPLLTFGIDATLGMSVGLGDERGLGHSGGVALTVGFLRVGRFHL